MVLLFTPSYKKIVELSIVYETGWVFLCKFAPKPECFFKQMLPFSSNC